MNDRIEAPSKPSSPERQTLEKSAFQKGINDYRRGMAGKSASSITGASSMPPVGFEKAYNDGWNAAYQQAIRDLASKSRRGQKWSELVWGFVSAIVCIGLGIAAVYKAQDGDNKFYAHAGDIGAGVEGWRDAGGAFAVIGILLLGLGLLMLLYSAYLSVRIFASTNRKSRR